MAGIAEKILIYAAGLPEGEVLSAKALLHLGSRAAVDQALSRLHRNGQLLRVGRGLYVRPVESRFGTRAPQPEKVIAGVAAITGETVAPSGAAAANALGLSTQVPIRRVYLTSGRTRRFRLGGQVVELKHAPNWQLRRTATGEVVRALAWLGRQHADEVVNRLKARLGPQERTELFRARRGLPSWLAEPVGRAFNEEAAHAQALTEP